MFVSPDKSRSPHLTQSWPIRLKLLCGEKKKGCGYSAEACSSPRYRFQVKLNSSKPSMLAHFLLLGALADTCLVIYHRAVLKTVALPHLLREVHLYPRNTPTTWLMRVNGLCLCCEVSWAPSASCEHQRVTSTLVCERMRLVSGANVLGPKIQSQKFWTQIFNTLHSNCTDMGDPVAS